MDTGILPLSVAPMLDWTDRHCRFFLRQIAPGVRLFTEMLTTGALLHGDAGRLLAHHAAEHPLVVQLGGSDPEQLARCARLAEQAGYDEVNLNVGCPSDRVRSGRFGACLMLEPDIVARAVRAMREAVAIPVSVKCRLGVDEQDSQALLCNFTGRLAEAGVDRLYVHARKAWLQGLSPKQNRELPPLQYERVYALKQSFPSLEIHLNGGIVAVETALAQLEQVDGVMIGRAAYQNPWLLARLVRCLGGVVPADRHAVVEAMLPYVEAQLRQGVRLHAITRHMLGLFQACPGARAWRRMLSEAASRPGAGSELLLTAAARVTASGM
ncbi:MAG TPA: tRNA dihydrouridine(20/20a) synthase DusA [Gammaproteobacteria bacterium]|nr:tRNA dihydrouridine(20/20a) synthase DusA [Gammaproteobacteria bacterium]